MRWYKLQKKLRKAKKAKRRAESSMDESTARQFNGKVDKVEQFSGENSKYTVEDFLWNLDCKFQIEGRAWVNNDQAKSRFASSCLSGKARDWFRAYRYQVNPDEARRVGLSTQALDKRYWSWVFFEEQLRRAFGTKDMKEKALKKWEALSHTGSIDEFCDEIERLMWVVDLSQTSIEHKLAISLKYELRKDWAKALNKPSNIMDQLSLLREMGCPIEDFNKTHKKEEKSNSSTSSGSKRKRGDDTSYAAPKKSRVEKSSGKFGRFSSKDEALQGIPQEVLEQRMRDKVCWRCGKGGHRAMDCRSNAPVTAKVAVSKGKEKNGKKPFGAKVSAASKKTSEDDQLQVAVSSSRIMELSTDDEMVDA